MLIRARPSHAGIADHIDAKLVRSLGSYAYINTASQSYRLLTVTRGPSSAYLASAKRSPSLISREEHRALDQKRYDLESEHPCTRACSHLVPKDGNGYFEINTKALQSLQNGRKRLLALQQRFLILERLTNGKASRWITSKDATKLTGRSQSCQSTRTCHPANALVDLRRHPSSLPAPNATRGAQLLSGAWISR